MRPPIPILRSFDETSAKAFYIDFLGFELTFEHRFEANTPLYMGIRRGACDLHISEHFGDSCPGSAIRIEMSGVAEYCAELNAKKYKNARPGFQDQEWGFRDMTIKDPSGNRIIFCEPLSELNG